MSIGYACLTLGVMNTGLKSCLQKNAEDETLARLIAHNLSSLGNTLDYNDKNNIRLFRISSDIIPFGSSPVNRLPWQALYKNELATLGAAIRNTGIRVSMHPGQYTVLNSPDRQVAERAIKDLMYHASFLDSLRAGTAHKIILHIGGAYGDKKAAQRRFTGRFRDLDDSVKQRLILENDDKSYHIGDVLALGAALGIPVVYDNLHNKINCCDASKDDYYWISQCAPTWQLRDGRQKVHYAQQAPFKKPGSHSGGIAIDEFLDFFAGLGANPPDIMLEVKDKNLSAVKCINCSTPVTDIKVLEQEWSRYKYAVLERSPNDYKRIRELLKDKASYPALAFYRAVENAYAQAPDPGNFRNAAMHVWGYFKGLASAAEKQRFFDLLPSGGGENASVLPTKRFLHKLAMKYNQDYLLHSYFFL